MMWQAIAITAVVVAFVLFAFGVWGMFYLARIIDRHEDDRDASASRATRAARGLQPLPAWYRTGDDW